MEKRTKGCLLIGLGVFLLLLMVGVAAIGGAGYWLYHQFTINAVEHTPENAAREMDAIRARFGDQQPLIVMEHRDGGDAKPRVEFPEERPRENPRPLESLHIAAYDPDDGKLVRFSLPFWLVRLSPEGKVKIGDEVLRDVEGGEQLTLERLEALGPGLLIDDCRANGHRVIVWTE